MHGTGVLSVERPLGDGPIERMLRAASRAYGSGRPEASGRDGRCHVNVHGEGGGAWCCEFVDGALAIGRALPEPSLSDADAVLETSSDQWTRVLAGTTDVAEAFHSGGVTVRGDMSLVMRLASVLATVAER